MAGGSRLRQFNRTATFAWSPGANLPWLAVGTVAGALDASFSTATELEIVDLALDGSSKDAVVKTLGQTKSPARFNRLAWSMGTGPHASQEHGVLAGGLENGELGLWNPSIILQGSGDPLLARNTAHTGPVRGLDFNPLQANLLSTGSNDGEIFIWDLTNPNKPYSPATRSTKLEDVTCVAWNRQVAHILASASNNGYTVIWDLRNRRELIQLAHPGGRKGITSISWNPDLPTQIVTASDDDNNPALLVWDLKNARAPEKALYGHTKGVLSVAWCPKDSDLMLSCGKDNHTLLWDPTTTEQIGTVDITSNWAFEVQWCPRNPDLLAIGGFDGTIAVHSLQNQGSEAEEAPVAAAPVSNDPFAFEQPGPEQTTSIVLQRPPKWMRRPCGGAWSFGGKLVTFKNAKKADGVTLSSVAVSVVPTEPSFAARVAALESASLDGSPRAFADLCQNLAQLHSGNRPSLDRDMWTFLAKLFTDNPRGEIVRYLGFDRNAPEHPPLPTVAGISTKPSSDDAFDLYPAENPAASRTVAPPKDFSARVTRRLVVGDLAGAVEACLACEQFTDALLLAVCGGADLLARTRDAILQKSSREKTYARVLDGCLGGRVQDLVRSVDLSGAKWSTWKDVLAMICTYASEDEFPAACEGLAEKLDAGAANVDARDRGALQLATLLLYITAGNVGKVLHRWTAPTKTTASSGKKSSILDRLNSMQDLAEKLLVLRQCLDFDAALDIQASSGTDDLGSLFLQYAQFAECVAIQGNLDEAWRSLERIPQGAITGETESRLLGSTRDRVYQTLPDSVKETIAVPPHLPFEIADMNLSAVQPEAAAPAYAATQVTAESSSSWSQTGYQPSAYAPVATSNFTYGVQGGYQAQTPAQMGTSFQQLGTFQQGPSFQQPSTFGQPPQQPFQPVTAFQPSPYQPQAQQQQVPLPPPQQPFQPAPPPVGPPPVRTAYVPQPPAPQPFPPPQQPAPVGQPYMPVAPPPATATVPPVFAQPPPAVRPVLPPPPTSAAPPQAFNDPPMVPNPAQRFQPTGPPPTKMAPITTPVAASPVPASQYQAAPPVGMPAMPPPPPQTQWTPSSAPLAPPPQASTFQPASVPVSTATPPPPPISSGFSSAGPSPPRPMVPMASTVPQQGAGFAPAASGYTSPMPARPPPTQQPSPAASVAPPAPPAKKRLAPGDLSGIPANEMPIVTAFQKWLQHARAYNGPQNKRILDDTEKRFGAFFDQLSNREVGDNSVVGKALELASALDAKQLDAAEKVRVELLTTKFDLTGQWIVGVKRLLDILVQLQANGQL